MPILRSTFTIAVLFVLCSPIAIAKHIIVIYDISGSMVSGRNRDGSVKKYMGSNDIRRVNDYLTDILFTDASQPLSDANKDSYFKECDTAYAGQPLYQSGDVLTYANYADRRDERISRDPVSRDEFQRYLPDPMELRSSFRGQVSYLDRAKVEVYNELYLETDEETYWISVTDGDIDHSDRRDPEIFSVLQELAKIEVKYDNPMILGLLVNEHVKIEVRQLQNRTNIDTVFITNRTSLNETVKEIQFSKDDAEQSTSETLIIDTRNPDKMKFRLNSVNVDIVDKDNTDDVHKGKQVLLHGHSPPYVFQIPFPENPEIAASSNVLRLELAYSYNGNSKTYVMPHIKYETVIDNIYLSDPDNPDQQAKQIDLRFSEDKYFTSLVIRSESPNKTAFRIGDIRCSIQSKDHRELCNASIATNPTNLNEPFQVVVPDKKDLNLYGNKLIVNIDYEYNSTAKFVTIGLPYKTRGSDSNILKGLLATLGFILLIAVVFVLIPLIRKWLSGSGVEYLIRLEEIDEGGMTVNEGQSFPFANRETLSFRSVDDGTYFDVGSPAILRCRRGEILLCENIDDKKGRTLKSGETLTLTRDEGDEVHIHFEIVDDASQSSGNSDDVTDYSEDENLLPD